MPAAGNVTILHVPSQIQISAAARLLGLKRPLAWILLITDDTREGEASLKPVPEVFIGPCIQRGPMA